MAVEVTPRTMEAELQARRRLLRETPATAPVDKGRVLAHLAAQLNQLEEEMKTAPSAKWDEQQLVLKEARLSAMRCKLLQPPGDGCIARLNHARLEAESTLLALEIEQSECAQRSST